MNRTGIAVPVLLVAAGALASPARAADFELWSEVGASVEVLDGLRLGFDQELRLDHGANELDCVRSGAHAAWRAAKWLSLRLGYRYELEPHFTKGADYADAWHEGYADATLRFRADRARVSLRLRYEQKRGHPWTADGERVLTQAARQRLEVDWRLLRGLSLVGQGELFVALGEPDGPLDKWRAGGGLDLALGPHVLALLYLYEQPFAVGDEAAHVIGLSYQFAP
jgi:hypothetical protein